MTILLDRPNNFFISQIKVTVRNNTDAALTAKLRAVPGIESTAHRHNPHSDQDPGLPSEGDTALSVCRKKASNMSSVHSGAL